MLVQGAVRSFFCLLVGLFSQICGSRWPSSFHIISLHECCWSPLWLATKSFAATTKDIEDKLCMRAAYLSAFCVAVTVIWFHKRKENTQYEIILKKRNLWFYFDSIYSAWSSTLAHLLRLNSLYNSILFHSLPWKSGALYKAITFPFPILAYFAPKWNKTRLMISITLTLLAVYSAWSLGRGAGLHKSRWWRTFTRWMIQ